jgi:hypothetical protein
LAELRALLVLFLGGVRNLLPILLVVALFQALVRWGQAA